MSRSQQPNSHCKTIQRARVRVVAAKTTKRLSFAAPLAPAPATPDSPRPREPQLPTQAVTVRPNRFLVAPGAETPQAKFLLISSRPVFALLGKAKTFDLQVWHASVALSGEKPLERNEPELQTFYFNWRLSIPGWLCVLLVTCAGTMRNSSILRLHILTYWIRPIDKQMVDSSKGSNG